MDKMLNTNKIGAIFRSWRVADASVVGGKHPQRHGQTFDRI